MAVYLIILSGIYSAILSGILAGILSRNNSYVALCCTRIGPGQAESQEGFPSALFYVSLHTFCGTSVGPGGVPEPAKARCL